MNESANNKSERAYSAPSIRDARRGNREYYGLIHFQERGIEPIGDLTKVSAALANRVAWKISEDYTYSEHQVICKETKGESSSRKNSRRLAGESF